MGDQAHLEQLENGAIQWNEWRRQNPEVEPDLSKFDLVNIDCRKEDRARAKQYAKEQALRKPVPGVLTPIVVPLMKGSVKGRRTPLGAINFANTNLSDSNLEYCNLMDADLSGANCRNADLSYASLDRANLHDAGLYNANLRGASLRAADLSDADLARALLLNADLSGAALNGVRLRQTVFAGTNLSGAAGLTRCLHWGPSVLDSRTLELSSMLPLSFLRACGLPEKMIENLKSILFSAREYFSCFVSYSTGDQSFTERLHADLQDSGVRCWFMQDDMLPGDRILDTIDKEVSGHERFLLILSEHALARYCQVDPS